MKHGQKTAKSVRKVSAKSSKVSRKAAPAQKSAGKKPQTKAKARGENGHKAAGKTAGKAVSKIPVKKSAADSKGSRAAAAGIDFTNPAVATAFKRALKKYPLALKRLTD